jgi:hypothetical protein
MSALQDRDLEGQRMNLHWAKAVRVPANAYGSTLPRAAAAAVTTAVPAVAVRPLVALPQLPAQSLQPLLAPSAPPVMTAIESVVAAVVKAAQASAAPAAPLAVQPSAIVTSFSTPAVLPVASISASDPILSSVSGAVPQVQASGTTSSTIRTGGAPSEAHTAIAAGPAASSTPSPASALPAHSGRTFHSARQNRRSSSGWDTGDPSLRTCPATGPAAELAALATRLCAACGVAQEDTRAMPPDQAAAAIRVRVPADRLVRRLIDLWAGYVVTDGTSIESTLQRQEVDTPHFSWLLDENANTDDARFYRWRVFSLLQVRGLLPRRLTLLPADPIP